VSDLSKEYRHTLRMVIRNSNKWNDEQRAVAERHLDAWDAWAEYTDSFDWWSRLPTPLDVLLFPIYLLRLPFREKKELELKKGLDDTQDEFLKVCGGNLPLAKRLGRRAGVLDREGRYIKPADRKT